jgi:hypothetical protein
MKKMRIIPWLLAFVLIFGFSGMAFGGGGGPESPVPCPAGTPEDPLPEQKNCKFLRGDFTVAREVGFCGDVFYSVHVELKKGGERHLFSFNASPVEDLCGVSEADLEDLFASAPCEAGVGLAFDLDGIPVISDLSITVQDSCETFGAMIKGEIVVCVPQDKTGNGEDD